MSVVGWGLACVPVSLPFQSPVWGEDALLAAVLRAGQQLSSVAGLDHPVTHLGQRCRIRDAVEKRRQPLGGHVAETSVGPCRTAMFRWPPFQALRTASLQAFL